MSDTRCGARREPANNFDEAARCDLRAGHTGYHRQLSPWQECWPQDVPVPSETGARREEGETLSEEHFNALEAAYDVAERREPHAPFLDLGAEALDRIENLIRERDAALHRARVAEAERDAYRQAMHDNAVRGVKLWRWFLLANAKKRRLRSALPVSPPSAQPTETAE
jgi:acyl-CoA reductase-like NAD-dependent aldehyde dehydrogenase